MKRNNNLVNYDVAKALKQIGFDYETLYYYDNHGEQIFSNEYLNYNSVEDKTSCPEAYVVRQWFRDKFNADSFIARLSNVTIPNLGYGFIIFNNVDNPDVQTYPYESYEMAEIYCIIYLINLYIDDVQ